MDNTSQINGNNNIVLQGINGESITININSLEEIQVYLDKALDQQRSELDALTQAQQDLLQKNIDRLTQIANDDFQPLQKDEMEEYAGRLTEKFYGRTEERQLIKDFISQENKGTLFLFGSPGIGKSALMAKTYEELLPENLQEGENAIHLVPYFIRRGTESAQQNAFFRYVNEAVESILDTQIAIKQDIGALRSGLHQRLRKAKEKLGQQKLVLLIDGLDEGNAAELLNQLSVEQYPNVLMIFSTRYTADVEKYFFDSRTKGNVIDTTLQGLKRAAITQMIQGIGAVYPIPTAVYPKIIENSKGNPKYLELLELSLKNGIIDFQTTTNVPVFTDGFNNFYDPLVRAYTDNEAGNFVLPILYTLSIAKDYLNSVQLAKITNFQTADTKKAIIILKEVLIEKTDHRNNPYYQLFHESLREYLVEKDYYELLEMKYALTDFCKNWSHFRNYMLKEYPVKHYGAHLFELIQEEKDDQAKTALYDLAMNRDFRKNQVAITQQYQPSFTLMEQAIKTTQLYEEPNPALDFAIETLQLHQMSQQANNRITDWSMAGGKTNMQAALTAIEGLAVELRPSTYALLLYDVLLGVNKNRLDKKEVATLIITHLDQHLDTIKEACQPFKFWILLVYELEQLDIPIDFFQKRTWFTTAMDSNPLHPKKWSAMQAFIATLDLSRPAIFEFVWQLLEKVLTDDSTEIGGGSSYTYFNHLLFVAQRLANQEAWQQVTQLETYIKTKRLQPLQGEKNTAAIITKDQGYICLIEMAILQKDFEKASAYIQHINDFVPAIHNMLKLVPLLNELGRVEEAMNFLEFVLQEGQPMYKDKRRRINFLCKVAMVLDKVQAPIEAVETFLKRALEFATSEKRVRSSEIKPVAKAFLAVQNITDATYIELSQQIIPHFKSSFESDDIADQIVRKLIKNQNKQGLTALSEHFSPTSYGDKLFNQADYFYQQQDLNALGWAIAYILPFLDQHIRGHQDKGQLFRFQLKTGALLMAVRPEEGKELIEGALLLQNKFYNDHILKSTFIYAFPIIYHNGHPALGLELAEKAIELTNASDDYNFQQLVKSLIDIDQLEKTNLLFEQLIQESTLSTYLGDIIQLLLEKGATEIATNHLQKLAQFPEKAKDVYTALLLDKHQAIVLPIFRNFFEKGLNEPKKEQQLEIVNQKDIYANLALGVFSDKKAKEAFRLSQQAGDFQKGLVLQTIAFYYYQQQYDSLLDGLNSISNKSKYIGIYFDAPSLEWRFIEKDSEEAIAAYEQQYLQADTPIFYDIALDLLAKNQLPTAINVAATTPDYEERERIMRRIVLNLIKKDQLIAGQQVLIQYLLKSKDIYFWQYLMLLLARKGHLKEALNYSPNFEQSQDSGKDDKRLELYMELAVLSYKTGYFEQALSLVSQLAVQPKPFPQNERKVAGVSQIIHHLARQKKQITGAADLENWLQTNIISEKEKTQCFYYSSWFLFYLEDYEGALKMVKYVDNLDDKDFYFLSKFSSSLAYKNEYDWSIRFALIIEDANDKRFPIRLTVEKLAQEKSIAKALNLLKTMPDYESENFTIEKIIKEATLTQLPLVYQFLQTDLKMMSEENRYKIHRKFLAKVCQYPTEINKWIHENRLEQIHHIDNLVYALFLEQLAAQEHGDSQKAGKIRAGLNV